jgi:hypothetical protein
MGVRAPAAQPIGTVQSVDGEAQNASHEKPGWFSFATTWVADTSQWTWEVGSAGAMGFAQGAANTVNGVQDGLIGTGNLAIKGGQRRRGLHGRA